MIEGIDIKKTSKSKHCEVCHYCIFLDTSFRFQLDACSEYQDVLMMSINHCCFKRCGVDYG